jgi:hypothetical protein
VNYCIAHDVLSDFLKEHGGEIVSILYAEYNEETAMRVRVDEEREDIAMRLLKRGLPIEAVIEDTGLREDVVKKLKRGISDPK